MAEGDITVKVPEGHIITAFITSPIPVTPPDPEPPDPEPEPPTGVNVLDVGFLTIQKEVSATRALLKKDGITTGQHMHSFGSNCEPPTDAGNLLDQNGIAENDGWLISGMSTSDTDVNGQSGCTSPDDNRPKDEAAARKIAQRVWEVVKSRPNIIGVTFWQEMKGYGVGNMAMFNSHAIAFAQELRRLGYKGHIAGPYTTGGYSDSQNKAVHESFIDNVVKPHPDLYDVAAWDHNDGAKASWYRDIWAAKGLGHIPHINTECYPGGWQPTSATTRTDIATLTRCLMTQATVPQMHWVLIWSTGGGGEDKSQKAWIVDSSGRPTSLYAPLKDIVMPFLRGGDVYLAGTDRWKNAAGKQLAIVNGQPVVTDVPKPLSADTGPEHTYESGERSL